ncbi:MAG: 2-oxoacid:acceptor oxidoreductase subunit alpha, partial [Patescibacteria group bacterium]|nr:2-oxoacid:acceptor oxidoreductase subunit alpha [Patescibacteria group bacterium]
YPFPAIQSHKVLSSQTRVIAVEQNATGQLCGLIREHTGFEIKEKFLKYNGRPFYPEEIIEQL